MRLLDITVLPTRGAQPILIRGVSRGLKMIMETASKVMRGLVPRLGLRTTEFATFQPFDTEALKCVRFGEQDETFFIYYQ